VPRLLARRDCNAWNRLRATFAGRTGAMNTAFRAKQPGAK